MYEIALARGRQPGSVERNPGRGARHVRDVITIRTSGVVLTDLVEERMSPPGSFALKKV
jgi:hypothetical protein